MAKLTPPLSLLLALFSLPASAELQPMDDGALSDTVARTNGITLDIDLSDIELIYSYKNTHNPAEDFWISAADVGGDLIQFNGITIDIAGSIPGLETPAIVIGAPTEIKLSNVKTGDYYLARSNPLDEDLPPRAGDITSTTNRKLFGLTWNSYIGIDFAGAGGSALVENYTFADKPFQADGRLIIFPTN